MTIPLQVIKANTHLEIHHDLIGLATEEQNKKIEDFFQNKIKRVLTCKMVLF